MWNLGLLGASVGGAAAGSYDLLETTILSSSQSSVTFSNLVSTYGSDYKHLQLRIVARDNRAVNANNTELQFNSDTGSNYFERHVLRGLNGSVSSFGEIPNSSNIIPFGQPSASAGANIFGVAVIDILDAFNTNKNTTTRSFHGNPELPMITLQSGLWMNTAAIDSIRFAPETTGSYVTGSRFSLYGLKESA